MTIVNEIILDGTPLGAEGVWYTADIADSSFVENVKIRTNEEGPAEIRYTLIAGGEYTYFVTDEFAKIVWDDLAEGYSPGQIYSSVRRFADNFYPSRGDYKVRKAVAQVTILGDEATIRFVVAHANALGLVVVE
jgi:hypothetical protein